MEEEKERLKKIKYEKKKEEKKKEKVSCKYLRSRSSQNCIIFLIDQLSSKYSIGI